MDLSRRDLMKMGVFGTAALALPLQRVASAKSLMDNRMPASGLPKVFERTFSIPAAAIPYRSEAPVLDGTGRVVKKGCDYYRITQRVAQAQILPGPKTTVWAYNGQVPGPTIYVNQGTETVVRQANELPPVHPTLGYRPWTSTHLHGSASLPEYDGYASDITQPGEFKDYCYPNFQPARTLWYHDHGVHHTGENVYMGLAAFYIMYDPKERALPLPKGRFDVPMVIADRLFQKNGDFLFDNSNHSGLYGDVILVNGVPWPKMEVKPRKYRFRVLNGSISRSFNYSLSTGDEFTVIGHDGGLAPYPVRVKNIRHGMAERYEIVIDFSKYRPGTRVVLQNSNPANNRSYANIDKIMAFDVVDWQPGEDRDEANNAIPDALDPTNPIMALTAKDAVRTRRFDLIRTNGLWTVNGVTWDEIVASGFSHVEANPKKGEVEIWEIRNTSGGWFHPTHVHLVDFKILDRNGKPPMPWEQGPKDVVYAGESEIVRIITRFEGCGKYMIHCHNLIHEDHDMMTQFEVIDPDHYGDDPMGWPAVPSSQEYPL